MASSRGQRHEGGFEEISGLLLELQHLFAANCLVLEVIDQRLSLDRLVGYSLATESMEHGGVLLAAVKRQRPLHLAVCHLVGVAEELTLLADADISDGNHLLVLDVDFLAILVLLALNS